MKLTKKRLLKLRNNKNQSRKRILSSLKKKKRGKRGGGCRKHNYSFRKNKHSGGGCNDGYGSGIGKIGGGGGGEVDLMNKTLKIRRRSLRNMRGGKNGFRAIKTKDRFVQLVNLFVKNVDALIRAQDRLSYSNTAINNNVTRLASLTNLYQRIAFGLIKGTYMPKAGNPSLTKLVKALNADVKYKKEGKLYNVQIFDVLYPISPTGSTATESREYKNKMKLVNQNAGVVIIKPESLYSFQGTGTVPRKFKAIPKPTSTTATAPKPPKAKSKSKVISTPDIIKSARVAKKPAAPGPIKAVQTAKSATTTRVEPKPVRPGVLKTKPAAPKTTTTTTKAKTTTVPKPKSKPKLSRKVVIDPTTRVPATSRSSAPGVVHLQASDLDVTPSPSTSTIAPKSGSASVKQPSDKRTVNIAITLPKGSVVGSSDTGSNSAAAAMDMVQEQLS